MMPWLPATIVTAVVTLMRGASAKPGAARDFCTVNNNTGTCICAGVNLESMQADGPFTTERDPEGYLYRFSICSPMTKEELPTGCRSTADDDQPTAVRYRQNDPDSCEVMGSARQHSIGGVVTSGMTGVLTHNSLVLNYFYLALGMFDNQFKIALTEGNESDPGLGVYTQSFTPDNHVLYLYVDAPESLGGSNETEGFPCALPLPPCFPLLPRSCRCLATAATAGSSLLLCLPLLLYVRVCLRWRVRACLWLGSVATLTR